MRAPVFSVIIPTYNRPEAVTKLLTKLKQQQFTDFEVVVVDDSAQNHSLAFSSFQELNLRYIHRGNKLGVSSARNAGAANASGNYLAFIDDDDTVSDTWLSDFYALIQEHNAPEILLCGMERTGKFAGKNPVVLPGNLLHGKGWKWIIFPGAFIIREDFYKQVGGYDDRILFGENTELFIRISGQNPRHAFTDNINFFYDQSHDGGSKNLVNKVESNKILLEKHAQLFERKKNLKLLVYQVSGVALLKLHRFKEARPYLFTAMRLGRFNIKAVIRLFMAYMPPLAKRMYNVN